MMKKIISVIILCVVACFQISGGKTLDDAKSDRYNGKVSFDYVTGEEGRRAYLRLPRGAKEVKAVLYCHQNMTEEVLFRSKEFCLAMDSLGVAMAFIQQGSQNWDVATGCQDRQSGRENIHSG